MSPLHFSDGSPFTAGAAPCSCRPAESDQWATRLFVFVRIGSGTAVEAVVDTGGAFLILPPNLAREEGLGCDSVVGKSAIVLRGMLVRGYLYRQPVTFVATQGESASIETTAFIPEIADGEDWTLPVFLGWHCCMERLRFGVDPFTERFYFGS